MKWKSHLPNLFKEIIDANPTAWALRMPVVLTRNILAELAEYAIKLDDPKLNVFMLRLALYEVSPENTDRVIAVQEKRPAWKQRSNPVGEVQNTRIDITDLERACVYLGDVRVVAAGSMYATLETDQYARFTLTKAGIRHALD